VRAFRLAAVKTRPGVALPGPVFGSRFSGHEVYAFSSGNEKTRRGRETRRLKGERSPTGSSVVFVALLKDR
jgi:hypothetical protein